MIISQELRNKWKPLIEASNDFVLNEDYSIEFLEKTSNFIDDKTIKTLVIPVFRILLSKYNLRFDSTLHDNKHSYVWTLNCIKLLYSTDNEIAKVNVANEISEVMKIDINNVLKERAKIIKRKISLGDISNNARDPRIGIGLGYNDEVLSISIE